MIHIPGDVATIQGAIAVAGVADTLQLAPGDNSGAISAAFSTCDFISNSGGGSGGGGVYAHGCDVNLDPDYVADSAIRKTLSGR